MLWFLLGTAALFGVLGDRLEAITLACAMVPLLGMDAWLHRRTEASTRGLKSRLAATAKALRDGALLECAARELVPGDLVCVEAGEPFPADGLIVGGGNIQVDESILTGESLPARKQPLAMHPGMAPLVDNRHWAAAGTRLLAGAARLRVTCTGSETLYGEIVRLAVRGRHTRTPLQAAIGRLVTILLVAALLVCAILAGIRLYQGHGLVDALLSAVTLAVAALPEEFPVVFTFFLGAGVYRLAKRQALVRRAVAVENIGRVTCICSDKTGTLTEGRLVLAHRRPAAGVTPDELVTLAAMASREDSDDPLDAAVQRAAVKPPGAAGRCVHSFPFTEARRCETASWSLASGGRLAVVKGAPETVLARTVMDDADRAEWLARVAKYAEAGHKVIACATLASGDAVVADREPEAGFAFAGLLAFEDPVREGVREAVQTCIDAGIRVVMVTGDHPGTAAAIAREIGLGGGDPKIVTLDEAGSRSPLRVHDDLRDVHVVARAVPAQKLELVRTLQERGEIVAVTGDGVNDVPALQAADIGIAMGERGTRSAREVAAIVLLDDNLRTIVRAIAEGRQLFSNLRLSFAYLLMTHIPLVLSAAIVPLAGYPLLYLPVHIVWLELVMHPTALLVFQDRPAAQRMAPGGRGRDARFFSPRTWSSIGFVGVLVTAGIVGSYLHALGFDRSVEHARAVGIAVFVLASAAITGSLAGLGVRAARVIVAATVGSLLLVQLPALGALLHLSPLHLGDWALAVMIALAAGASICISRTNCLRRRKSVVSRR